MITFSAIFGEKIGLLLKNHYYQCLAQNLALSLFKNVNFFTKFFDENI
jgi:hypothetical protein